MADVESRLARLEQRVDDHDKALIAMAPLVTTVAVLARDLQSFGKEFAEFREFINHRDERVRNDRKWAIGLAVLILCALIGLIGVIIAAGMHP